jgi:ribosomal peptide maturation radical SAM protein 1
MRHLRIALVAMPWAMMDVPSAALGVLAAVLRRERPDHKVDCFYSYLDVWKRLQHHYNVVCTSSTVGELFYAGHLYPERRTQIRERFVEWYTKMAQDSGTEVSFDIAEVSMEIERATIEHLDELVDRLSSHYDLVGVTATVSQLFASLALLNRLRQRDTGVCLVLGGATVGHEVGESLLQEYPAIDYLVQGEGEHALIDLVDRVAADGHQSTGNGRMIEAEPVAELDWLPVPDYREYNEIADDNSIYWYVPIEGSRGCWWNRVERTGNPMQACYFCGLNLASYREKSEERVVSEMAELVDTYRNVRVRFFDNVVRQNRVTSLATKIRDLGKQFELFFEVRANISPYELLMLWESGCFELQIGVEGLSDSYLKRIGKGTRVIQNLQAMKTCFELGLRSRSNLLIGFPGSTRQEVEETLRAISDFSIAYEPLSCSPFGASHNSSVTRNPEAFGVTRIRNSSDYSVGLPDDVNQRLVLPKLSHDNNETADWAEVVEACVAWKKHHRELVRGWPSILPKPLFYNDGACFLEIVDRRAGFRLIELEGLWRQIYLYCLQIRSVDAVRRKFPSADNGNEAASILASFEKEKLLYRDGDRVLSLACAATPQHAAERIRKAESQVQTRSEG